MVVLPAQICVVNQISCSKYKKFWQHSNLKKWRCLSANPSNFVFTLHKFSVI